MDREKLLTALRQEARELQRDDVPEFLGALETIRCYALAVLTAPSPIPKPDALLTVKQVAERLNVSCQYVYSHAKDFDFFQPNKTGRGLRFSSAGLDAYLKRAQ